MRAVALLAAFGLGLCGCTRSEVQDVNTTPLPSSASEQPQDALPARPAVTSGVTGVPVLRDDNVPPQDVSDSTAAPDNTSVNQRDRSNAELLPTDQGENEADLQTTAEIRRRIVDLSRISISARNIKIITREGKVTLRGPVATQEEQQTLERIARDVAGQDNVDSQLEVTRS